MPLPAIYAELRANTGEFMTKMGAARAEVGKLDGSAASFGKFGKAAALGLAGIGVAAVAIGIKTADMASKYDAAMEKIKTQDQATQGEVDKMKSAVLGLAGKTAQAPMDLADAMIHVEGAGFRGSKAINILNTAAKAATISHANLTDVTNALDAAVFSGIPGAQNLDQAMGGLNATVGAGDMQMQDLADAMSTGMVAAVKGYGLSLTDVGASLALFGDNNIRGQNAATMLRVAVQSMAVPAKGGAKELAHLGLTANSLATDMQKHGLLSAVQDLKKHLDAAGVSSKQTGQVITTAFGKKAGTGINLMVDELPKLETKYTAVTAGANKFGSAWKSTTETTAFKVKSLESAFEALGIKIGEKLLPVFGAIISAITPVVEYLTAHVGPAFDAVSRAMKPLESLVSKIGNAIRSAFSGGTSSQVSGIATQFGKVRDAVQKAYDFIHSVASQILGVIVTWMKAHEAEIKQIMHSVVTDFQDALALIARVITIGVDIFRKLWDTFGKYIVAQIRIYLNLVIAIVKDVFKALQGLFDIVLGLLTGNWSRAWNGIKEVFSAVWDLIKSIATAEWNSFKNMFGAILHGLSVLWSAIWNGCKSVFSTIWPSIKGMASGALNYLWGLVKSILGYIGNYWTGVWNGLVGLFQGAWYKVETAVYNGVVYVLQFFEKLPGWIWDALKSLGSYMEQIGQWIVQGLVNGIKNAAGAAINAVKGVGSDIKGAFKSVLGIFSPSKVMAGYGANIVEGLANGITANAAKATAATRALGTSVKETLAQQISGAEVSLKAAQNRVTGDTSAAARDKKDYTADLAKLRAELKNSEAHRAAEYKAASAKDAAGRASLTRQADAARTEHARAMDKLNAEIRGSSGERRKQLEAAAHAEVVHYSATIKAESAKSKAFTQEMAELRAKIGSSSASQIAAIQKNERQLIAGHKAVTKAEERKKKADEKRAADEKAKLAILQKAQKAQEVAEKKAQMQRDATLQQAKNHAAVLESRAGSKLNMARDGLLPSFLSTVLNSSAVRSVTSGVGITTTAQPLTISVPVMVDGKKIYEVTQQYALANERNNGHNGLSRRL